MAGFYQLSPVSVRLDKETNLESLHQDAVMPKYKLTVFLEGALKLVLMSKHCGD